MAALVCRHAFSATCREFSPKYLGSVRNYPGRAKPVKLPKPEKNLASYESEPRQIDAFKISMQSRGFLRKTKAYTPPSDVSERFNSIVNTVFPANWEWNKELLDREKKFQLLTLCWKEFNHDIPNSMLTAMNSIDDVADFYQTEVKTVTPLDALKNVDLPPNLHVQYNPHRFHPDTDTMFGGVSAFPKSSTIVTGLKAKKIYKGYTAKQIYE